MSASFTFLRSLYDVALHQARPEAVVPAHLPTPPKGRTVVIGAGKAAAAMALAFESHWPASAPLSGDVVTRDGHVPSAWGDAPRRIRVHEAAHPVPDARGLTGVQRLREALVGLGPDDLVVALISGGGSALLPAPWPGATLADEAALNEQLLRCGASITEMNTVRRHLSTLKGGRLAQLCRPARLWTLVMSDVPGDGLADIASGPTVPDPTTCADTLAVIARYGLQLPEAALAALARGDFETPKPGDAAFAHDEVRLIAAPRQSLQAAADWARAHGVTPWVLGDALEGEAREVAIVQAGMALAAQAGRGLGPAPCVLLSGGEATVTLPRDAAFKGVGGRCSEFALAAALYLRGAPGIWGLVAGTDGIDGRGDAAGAVFGPQTLADAQALGLDAAAMLAAHDSGTFFGRLGAQVVTGPTCTNVNDFRALLVMPA